MGRSTLLVIVYDEHGGCFDHVSPPPGRDPARRLCRRVRLRLHPLRGPRPGRARLAPDRRPAPSFGPRRARPLDHTSILATIERRFEVPPLTARDAAAADLGAVLSLTTPRTDDPLHGVRLPVSTAPTPGADLPSHLQRIQAELAAALPAATHLPTSRLLGPLHTNADYATFIDRRTAST